MKIIDDFLRKLEAIIQSGNYVHVENDRIELKDNSHEASDWTEVYKTINAFLNTEGGIIVIGVKEDTKNRKYSVTGFNFNNEEKTREIRSLFTDENNVFKPVDELIHFETKPFFEKTLLVIYVDSFADDAKYAFYKRVAYERIITGDHKISKRELERQKEYKNEMADARELQVVKDASIGDLSVDKLNDCIQLLNRETKVESIKASIDDAASFLMRQSMIRDSKPTFVGMLVCGHAPKDKLHFRCQVDAFVEALGQNIARDKKIINDTVLQLSDELYPIFIIDRQLFQKDFKAELKKILGERYIALSSEYKSVLGFIYERNTIAEDKYPSANEVGGKLWIMRGNADKLVGYEAYKRKVRKIINSLEAGAMLKRNDGKAKYYINQQFGETPALF